MRRGQRTSGAVLAYCRQRRPPVAVLSWSRSTEMTTTVTGTSVDKTENETCNA